MQYYGKGTKIAQNSIHIFLNSTFMDRGGVEKYNFGITINTV